VKASDSVFLIKSRRPDVPGMGMRRFLLSYTLFLLIGPVVASFSAWQWMLTALSFVVFLVLYFAAWRAIDDRRDQRALHITMAMAVLGLALIPVNVGGNTYVVYSAALGPFLLAPRRAMAYLALLIVAVGIVSLLLQVSARLWLVVPTTIVIIMVGGLNMFYAEHHRRNAKLFQAQEDVEQMATLAERERISRDLHDLLGHTLSVIALKSELASRIANTDPQRAAEEIRDVERVSRDALSEVRAAVEGYRSLGFSGELRNTARALESVGVTFEAALADVKMPARIEGVIALALRECITNIVRHAHARTCHVSLTVEDNAVVLRVRDDGAGGRLKEGHGLAGMRERVAAVRGNVSLDGSRGMTVMVSVPLS
jgi:two-component system, NarL family, sensor histidine kinase DesK